MRMRWVDLLFAHWPVAVDALRPLVPIDLEIDTFDGRAYLGIVPFLMEDVAPRGLPALPRVGSFPEVNVRTYVKQGARGGVWFLSLDAASRIAVAGARIGFHLPYFHASMSIECDGDAIGFRSERRDERRRPAALEVRYRPVGAVARAAPSSLEAWLTDRLRLFAVDGRGQLTRTEIRHEPWPLRPAEAEFRVESLAAAHGLGLPDEPPHLRFVDRLDVLAWWPRPL
jgi:uncharacterized protein YqjF (DUF2071 family)